ncbi:MAG: hypothetical protein Fur0037_05500 [Planctomycetota bacterium]
MDSPRIIRRHSRAGRLLRAAALLSAGLAPALLGSCAALTTMFPASGLAAAPRPVPGTDLLDFKGVIHCHSHLSHDSDGRIEDIAAACEAARIDFLVMTDHQTERSVLDGVRGMRGRTLFVVGAEQRTPQGTIEAFPLVRPLKQWRHAGLLAREAAEQGGVALLCHAENTKAWGVPGMAGVEIVNLHAGAVQRPKGLTLLKGLFFPVRVLLEHICHRDEDLFRHWDVELAARHPFTPVGGNDAHANVRLFGPLGGTIGTYREIFLTLSTHVLAPRLDERSLVEAISQGRTYVSFDIFGEGTGFDFRAEDENGLHVVGSTVRRSSALDLRVRLPGRGVIRLLRDGKAVAEREGEGLRWANPEPGVYRVEVRTVYGSPWLFSSSIRIAKD